MREIHQRLLKMHGKHYGVYKSLRGQYFNFGDFTLKFTHIQGDPHAQPSRLMLSAKMNDLGFDQTMHDTQEKQIALADFLLREFKHTAENISIVKPHCQIMQRNSLFIKDGIVRILVSVNLPGDGRRIDGEKASELLIGTLSDWITSAMYWNNSDKEKCKAHLQCLANRNFLLAQLSEKNLCAFVPNGAILPRESGDSELPMQNAVPFESPAELQVNLTLQTGETIAGMGIPLGITMIAGGGFHGKSTLLHALEEAVYPHIPGDGRELIVIDSSATPVKTEEGRVVNGTNISALVKELPLKGSTENFRTKNASGATSQAANLLEAFELGVNTVLIDEDASAVNFLIRDERMRNLIKAEREPLIPLTDKIKEFSNTGINFIIVAGACGDYIELADTIIAFTEYRAECLKKQKINYNNKTNNKIKNIDLSSLQPYLKPASPVEKNVKIKVNAGQISIGELKCDLRKFPTFCNTELYRGIAVSLMQKDLTAYEDYDVAVPRSIEVGAAFLRIF